MTEGWPMSLEGEVSFLYSYNLSAYRPAGQYGKSARKVEIEMGYIKTGLIFERWDARKSKFKRYFKQLKEQTGRIHRAPWFGGCKKRF